MSLTHVLAFYRFTNLGTLMEVWLSSPVRPYTVFLVLTPVFVAM